MWADMLVKYRVLSYNTLSGQEATHMRSRLFETGRRDRSQSQGMLWTSRCLGLLRVSAAYGGRLARMQGEDARLRQI